MDNKICEANES